jgi:hypothetical protein
MGSWLNVFEPAERVTEISGAAHSRALPCSCFPTAPAASAAGYMLSPFTMAVSVGPFDENRRLIFSADNLDSAT